MPARETSATRWVVTHANGEGRYVISDNFLTEETALAFAHRQSDKGRLVVSIVCDVNFRLDF